jgi:hypothetical protein
MTQFNLLGKRVKPETEKFLIITSCSSKKLKRPAKARYLYQGTFFKKAQNLAWKHDIDYLILSAKYGIVWPWEKLDPYDKTITLKKDIIKLRKEVIPAMKKIQKDYKRIILIMGKKYREILRPVYNHKYFALINKQGIGGYLSDLTELQDKPFHFLKKRLIKVSEVSD